MQSNLMHSNINAPCSNTNASACSHTHSCVRLQERQSAALQYLMEGKLGNKELPDSLMRMEVCVYVYGWNTACGCGPE